MEGTKVLIQGKEYIIPTGYPKFGFYHAENGMYSVANVETQKVTDCFIEEIILQDQKFPLETWTADYVVCRCAGDKHYHLLDCDGNVYFEEEKPFIICRNGFVTADYMWFIAKGLKRSNVCITKGALKLIEYDEEEEYEYEVRRTDRYYLYACGGYNFALAFKHSGLLNVNGEVCDAFEEERFYGLNYENIHNWLVTCEDDRAYFNILYDFEFTPCHKVSQGVTHWLGYWGNGIHKFEKYLYSSKLNCTFCNGEKIGDTIFLESENKKSVHIILSDGTFEKLVGQISTPKVVMGYIMYIYNRKLIIRDFLQGNVVGEQVLSWQELFNYVQQEELINRLKALKG